ncbi:hypothetical protein [Streptomyces sp. NPDC001843]|uniref:hypothetical protein n=1 Tax=Streptomyces sp. NPDC001843 TaxID=3364617 RepID=UPI0036B21C08
MTDGTLPPPYADEAARWSRLAALLPDPVDVDVVQGCWDIGEQEDGLTVLVEKIHEQGLAVDESARAELAVMAEQWGVWDQLGPDIARCGPAADAARLRVFPDDAGEPLPAGSVLTDLPAPGLFLVPWICCARCGRVLARGHRLEEWGELSYLPLCYVVFTPGGTPAPTVHDHEERGAAWSALAAVTAGCPVRRHQDVTHKC